MKNLAVQVVDRLFIVLYGFHDPTDEEWSAYLELVERHGIEQTMQLICTDGGEPTSAQRRQLSELVAGCAVPVAVVSGSPRVRVSVTALSWFNRNIKAFPPSRLRDAIKYLGIPEQAEFVERTLRIARSSMDMSLTVEIREHKALTRATRALEFAELLVPRRVAMEELGDAMEVIVRLVQQARPAWQVYLKVATTVFWVVVNAFRPSGRRAAAKRTTKKQG